MLEFRANGKLLITGEYLVLDGAKAFAIPTDRGQRMTVSSEVSTTGRRIYWTSFDESNEPWFEATFDHHFRVLHATNKEVGERLSSWLLHCAMLNPAWLQNPQTIMVSVYMDFPRNWGLGTSSTLLAMLAEWAEVDAYQLLDQAFTGSGYDLACAVADGPIVYCRNAHTRYKSVHWNPAFANELFLVYSGNKQHSDREVARYATLQFKREEAVERMNKLTEQLIDATTLREFEALIETHESFIGDLLGEAPIKQQFSDYPGAIKSLGAWGGDFYLATRVEARSYFATHQMGPVFSLSELCKLSRTS